MTQTFTFHATRLNAGHVERRLREMAEATNVEYEVTIRSGFVTREVAIVVTGDEESVAEFDGYSSTLLNTKDGGHDGSPGG